MAMSDPSCPRCGKRMSRGFILELDQSSKSVIQWMPGLPIRSFWGGIKTRKDELIPIATFRCPACGFLESYAREEFAPQSASSARSDD